MSFVHPLLLGLIPLLAIGVFALFLRRAAPGEHRPLESAKRLWADRRGLVERPSRLGRPTRGVFLVLGLSLAVAALARPQWGALEETSFDQAREVVLALDLSRSMTADDVKPTRLERSKLLIESLLDELRGERVGLIVFAGTGFLQSPLSADYEVMRDLLPQLDPSYLPQSGTNYSAVIEAGLEAFRSDAKGDRFLVILSDGEAHDDRWESLVPRLQEEGIRVIGIGVGSAEGALLADGQGGYMKDERGAAVLSRLEPATLERLAEETGGVYVNGASWVDLPALVDETVAQGFRGDFVEEKQVRRQEQFQWLLGPAIALLLLAFWRELPVVATARRLSTVDKARARPRAPRAVGTTAALWLAFGLVLGADSVSTAQPQAPPHGLPAGAQRAPADLRATVAALVAKQDRVARDYAELAETTIEVASTAPSPTSVPASPALQGPTRVAVIDDALRGVGEGERLDPEAAEWSSLRAELLRLREAPPEQQQQQQQQQQEQQDQQDQSSEESSEESQQEGGESGDSESSQEGSSGDPSADSEEASDSSDPGEQGDQKDQDQQGEQGQQGGEESAAERSEVDSESASLGELEEPAPTEREGEESGSRPEPAPADETRMVGGGSGRSSDLEARPELAAALSRMEQVRNQDSPAVLFQRMSEQGSEPQQQDQGRNW